MEGRVRDVATGDGGFGYDPYFVAAGHDVSNAELSAVEKDAISHRGRAFRAIRPHVEALVASGRVRTGGPHTGEDDPRR